MALIPKNDLPGVVEALHAIVHGEQQPALRDAEGNVKSVYTRRFKLRNMPKFTLGRALRHLQPLARKVQEQFQEDHRELFAIFGDGERIPKERTKEYQAAYRELEVELERETVECPYTVKLSDLDLDDELPIGALGELVVEDHKPATPTKEED